MSAGSAHRPRPIVQPARDQRTTLLDRVQDVPGRRIDDFAIVFSRLGARPRSRPDRTREGVLESGTYSVLASCDGSEARNPVAMHGARKDGIVLDAGEHIEPIELRAGIEAQISSSTEGDGTRG